MDDPKPSKPETATKPRPRSIVVEEVVDEKVDTSSAPPEAEIVSKMKQTSPTATSSETDTSLPSTEEATSVQGQELATPPGEEPEFEEKPKRNIKMILFIVVLVAIVVALLGGGIYVFLSGTNKSEAVPTPTPLVETEPAPIAVEEQEPESAPEAERDLAAYEIQVLNGSGQIGVASKAKELLEENGFKVRQVGNASSYDFEKTVIQAKKEVEADVIDTLKDILSENYSVEIGSALAEDSNFDIVVTMGSE